MAPISLGLGLGLTKGGGGSAALAGPIYDADFAAGAALPAGFTHTRATVAWRRNSSGLWESVASGVLRYHHTAAGVPLGILIEEARTSRALWNRDLTNAIWVKTDITAAKNATGITGVASSASTLTATAASGTVLQPGTHISLARIFHPWVRRKTGTGTVEITLNGGTNWTDVTSLINSSTYTQVSVTATVTNPSVGFRLTASGDEIEVDFAELTDGTYSLSPFETTTASGPRSFDSIMGPVYPSECSISFAATRQHYSGITATLIGTSVNSAFRFEIGSTGTININDTGSTSTTANTVAISTAFKAGFVLTTIAAKKRVVLNGGTVVESTLTDFIPGTMNQLGARSSAVGVLNSTIARFKVWDRALSNAELQAETT